MIYNYFPVKVRNIVKKCMEGHYDIEEIRVRCGQNIVFCNRHRKWFTNRFGNFTKRPEDGIKLVKDDLKEMLKYFTQNSVYAMQHDIKNGFITLPDGTRVGLCGRCVIKNGCIENICDIFSYNIRLPGQVPEWGTDLFHKISADRKNVLIIAPPGLGKTTLLRNMIKYASDRGVNVSVIDEKSEISPVCEGNRIFDLGLNTDVLGDASKECGINIVLRTMNPEVIAVDELLTKEDFTAVKNAILSGVKIFATFHGNDKQDFLLKSRNLGADKLDFDYYITISENERNERILNIELQEEL